MMMQCTPTHLHSPLTPQALQICLQHFCRTISTFTKLSVMFFLPLQSVRGPQVASFLICICLLFPFLPVSMFLLVYVLSTSFDGSQSCKLICPYIQSNSDYQFLKFSVIFSAFVHTEQEETECIYHSSWPGDQLKTHLLQKAISFISSLIMFDNNCLLPKEKKKRMASTHFEQRTNS